MKDTAGGRYLAGLCYGVLGPQVSSPARVQPNQETIHESLVAMKLVLLDTGRRRHLRVSAFNRLV